VQSKQCRHYSCYTAKKGPTSAQVLGTFCAAVCKIYDVYAPFRQSAHHEVD
jgi:hypothetical protein